jgi:hypothetical protein
VLGSLLACGETMPARQFVLSSLSKDCARPLITRGERKYITRPAITLQQNSPPFA